MDKRSASGVRFNQMKALKLHSGVRRKGAFNLDFLRHYDFIEINDRGGMTFAGT
jgi:hypothetical protein